MNPIELFEPFIKSLENIFVEMAQTPVTWCGPLYEDELDVSSLGVISIVSFIGKIKGRLLINLEPNLALKLTDNAVGLLFESAKDAMVIACVNEINNTIAGDSITQLNNLYSLALRLTSPIILIGNDVTISIPKISTKAMAGMTNYGKFMVNIAVEWEL